MKLVFSEQAWEDYLYWQKIDKKQVKRINDIIREIIRTPHMGPNKGMGKPEPLKHALSGYWSRRINDEHRIVYKVADESLFIAQLRYHY